MRDHFGVGLRLKYITKRFKTRALFFVIFDNAVMHHGNITLGEMRMGVAFSYAAVGGPARMPDAHIAGEFLRQRFIFHFNDSTDAAHPLQAIIQHGDTGRIVAAIFEAL